jgi:hypothetical protein
MSNSILVARRVAELAEHHRLSGKVWVSTIADIKVTDYWGPPKVRELYWTVYFAGLRKLGVPEEYPRRRWRRVLAAADLRGQDYLPLGLTTEAA